MGIMGGGGSNTAFGSSTVDVVEKAAFWFAIAFFVLAILAAIAFADSGPRVPEKDAQNTEVPATQGTPATQANPAPANPAPAPAQP